jgi:hypothetical protein
MKDQKNRCKLCGGSLAKSETHKWCEDCRGGIELITYLRENLIPINEETIAENIDKFIVDFPFDKTSVESSEMERYLDLNYSIEQYEKIKSRSERIRKKLKLN